MNRKRNKVETANDTVGSGLAQFPYEIDLLPEPERFSFTVNLFINVNQLVYELAALLDFIGYPMLLIVRFRFHMMIS
jgi:hypothetical protein